MIEVLKQALEALETCGEDEVGQGFNETEVKQAITSLRQAIKELESQEPVAWMDATGFIYKIKPEPIWPEVHPLKPLYTHPPQRKPLTDGQIYSMVADITDVRSPYLQFARAIEAAHGIKE